MDVYVLDRILRRVPRSHRDGLATGPDRFRTRGPRAEGELAGRAPVDDRARAPRGHAVYRARGEPVCGVESIGPVRVAAAELLARTGDEPDAERLEHRDAVLRDVRHRTGA